LLRRHGVHEACGFGFGDPELSTLAERLVNAKDPGEASRVRETIIRGFYGSERDA
jgi:hypothetical protein